MLTLPDAILPVLLPFATLFRNPTWLKAQIMLVGAILPPSQRTVVAVFCVIGLSDDRNCTRYHHALNRATWSSLQLADALPALLLQHLDQGDHPLVFGIDETMVQRGGPKSRSGASTVMRCEPAVVTWSRSAACAGFPRCGWDMSPGREAVGPCRCSPCWRPRHATTGSADAAIKKLTDRAQQMILQLRRWLPHHLLVLVGDSGYAVLARLYAIQAA